MSKETVKKYKEQEMFDLIKEAVEDLHRIGDRLESYVNHLTQEGEEYQELTQGEDNA